MTTSTSPRPIFRTVDRPCPPWCALPAGHGWDGYSSDGTAVTRGHGLDYSGRSPHAVGIFAEEHAPAVQCCHSPGGCDHDAEAAGPSTIGPVEVSVDVAANLSADDAEQVAAWLHQAAAVVRALTTGGAL